MIIIILIIIMILLVKLVVEVEVVVRRMLLMVMYSVVRADTSPLRSIGGVAVSRRACTRFKTVTTLDR